MGCRRSFQLLIAGKVSSLNVYFWPFYEALSLPMKCNPSYEFPLVQHPFCKVIFWDINEEGWPGERRGVKEKEGKYGARRRRRRRGFPYVACFLLLLPFALTGLSPKVLCYVCLGRRRNTAEAGETTKAKEKMENRREKGNLPFSLSLLRHTH